MPKKENVALQCVATNDGNTGRLLNLFLEITSGSGGVPRRPGVSTRLGWLRIATEGLNQQAVDLLSRRSNVDVDDWEMR